MIHKLHSEMTRLVKRYMGYILPATMIVDIPVKEVSLRQEHQLANTDLFIGAEIRAFLEHQELGYPLHEQYKYFSKLQFQVYTFTFISYLEVLAKIVILP